MGFQNLPHSVIKKMSILKVRLYLQRYSSMETTSSTVTCHLWSHSFGCYSSAQAHSCSVPPMINACIAIHSGLAWWKILLMLPKESTVTTRNQNPTTKTKRLRGSTKTVLSGDAEPPTVVASPSSSSELALNLAAPSSAPISMAPSISPLLILLRWRPRFRVYAST